jgi:hypothetical protein
VTAPTAPPGHDFQAELGDLGPTETCSRCGFHRLAHQGGIPRRDLDTSEEVMTVADVAKALGVRASTVRGYLARRAMPAAEGRVGNVPWWRPATIAAWLAARPGRGDRSWVKGMVSPNPSGKKARGRVSAADDDPGRPPP